MFIQVLSEEGSVVHLDPRSIIMLESLHGQNDVTAITLSIGQHLFIKESIDELLKRLKALEDTL